MFEGVITALVTPFRRDLLDEDALRRLVDEQIAAGVDGLVPVGTTGESPTLTNEEHIRVVEVVIEAAAKRVPVIAGTGSNATSEAIESRPRPRRRVPTACSWSSRTTTGRPRNTGPPLPGDHAGDIDADHRVQRPGAHGLRPAARDDRASRRDARARRRERGDGIGARAAQVIARVGPASPCSRATTLPRCRCSRSAAAASSPSSATWRRADDRDVTRRGGRLEAGARAALRLFPLGEGLFIEANPIPVKAALAMMGRMTEEIRPPLYPLAEQYRAKLRAQLDESGPAGGIRAALGWRARFASRSWAPTDAWDAP